MRRLITFLFAVVCFLATSKAAMPQSVPRPDRVVLVFIPGIYGSILKADNDETLWGNNGIGELGLSLVDIPDAKPALFADVKFSVGVFGKTLRGYSGFENVAGFLAGQPLIFPYDWRRSNRTSAQLLEKFLCKHLRSLEKPYRFVFVAHSMGGLVLRHWIKNHMGRPSEGCVGIGNNDVAQFIFAGTPHLGSMETVLALLSGETSLEDNPLYASLFTGGMAKYGTTFESAYELLPARNIAGPSCTRISRQSARLEADIGTGKNVPLYLDSIDTWKRLKIPSDLPEGLSRSDTLKLIKKRITDAAKVVCDLNKYAVPASVARKMNFVVGELRDKRNPSVFSDSTIESIEIKIARNGEEIAWNSIMAKGDGTVPHWSAEPSAVNSEALPALPHSSYNAHAELLDDAIVVGHLQRILDRAATEVAWLTEKPLGEEITNGLEWEKARTALVNSELENMSPEIIQSGIDTLAKAADELGISNLDIYRNARAYSAGGSRSEHAYKAVGFAIASTELQDGLNDQSTFWALQNSSINWLKIGNSDMAISTALAAGRKNAGLSASPSDKDSKPAAKLGIKKFENAWRSVILAYDVSKNHPEVAQIVKDASAFDPSVFENVADIGYNAFDRSGTNVLVGG